MLNNITHVMVNGRRIEVNGVVSSLDDLKDAVKEHDPGVENATPVVEGDTVVWRYNAGTKGNGLEGVTHVMVNGRRIEINGTVSSLDDLKDAVKEHDPGVENATPLVEGDTIVWRYNAGTKGK